MPPARRKQDTHGPLGDAIPGRADPADTEGGKPPEKPEDRPGVSRVRPEDYPDKDR